jgi:hypothetical protein
LSGRFGVARGPGLLAMASLHSMMSCACVQPDSSGREVDGTFCHYRFFPRLLDIGLPRPECPGRRDIPGPGCQSGQPMLKGGPHTITVPRVVGVSTSIRANARAWA